jgi:hypothetical protein
MEEQIEDKIVFVRLKDVAKSGYLLQLCDKYHINEWFINEGADGNYRVGVTLEDAEYWKVSYID